ncbi:MAG: transposase [Candidatus Paceibacteria bacterium]
MLDTETRLSILRLTKEGYGSKKIADTLGISRNSVRKVIRSGTGEVPKIERPRILESNIKLVQDIYIKCEKNIVRVQEELMDQDINVKYSTLTKFCRDFEISQNKKVPVCSIITAPGEEGQHDTSPHKIVIGGKKVIRHCASYILGFSRRIYMQYYPNFTRFHCKIFLTEAFQYMDGAAARCVIDNTHVVIVCGTGKRAQFSPEMEAFEKRFGFKFMAHEVGNFKRKGKVERPFYYIERNFLAGRTFRDDADLNRQALEWCSKKANVRTLREMGQTPDERYIIEKSYLINLPIYIPEVYRIYHRDVDKYSYIPLHGYKYSVPASYIGKTMDIRETKDQVIIYHGPQEITRHKKLTEFDNKKQSTHPEHRHLHVRKRNVQILEETKLKSLPEPVPSYITFIKKEYGQRYIYSIKQMYRLYCEYAEQELIEAVKRALKYKLRDVRRLENIILNNIARRDFLLPVNWEPSEYEKNPDFIKGQHTPDHTFMNYAASEKDNPLERKKNDRGNTPLPDNAEIKKD